MALNSWLHLMNIEPTKYYQLKWYNSNDLGDSHGMFGGRLNISIDVNRLVFALDWWRLHLE
jgi:hypothetical protein